MSLVHGLLTLTKKTNEKQFRLSQTRKAESMSWPDYFDACARNDLFAAFEALVSIGVLPLVIGEDKKGKIKRPMAGAGEAWQNITTDEWKDRLVRYLQNGVNVGIGCKPVGHVVIDVDTLDKDTRRLPTAWKEAAQLLFGSDDWPRSMVSRTEGGAHVWFVVTDSIMKAWNREGKLKIYLPSGDSIEIFVGLADKGSQVACAPSEGKRISIPMEPIPLPESAEQAILRALTRPEKAKDEPSKVIGNISSDYEWAKTVLAQGYLDTELVDYDKWLAVGMALSHKFGEEGAELWEEWSARHDKHVDGECGVKVRSFKRTDGDKQIRFGSLIQIAKANGAAPPQLSAEPLPVEFFEGIGEAANTADIRSLMKDREWLWGNKEHNVGWFIQRGLHLVEGKEGTGKTRWIMDLARRWSLDMRWPDGSKTEMDPDAKVLFVASDSHWDQIAMTAEAFGMPDENVIFTGPQDVIDISLVPTWSRLGKAHIAQSASDLHEMLASIVGVAVPMFDSVSFKELGTIKAVEFLLADQVDGWSVDDFHFVSTPFAFCFASHTSSRSTLTSSGASTPILTLSPLISVTQTLN
jgi:hypothetical protein